VVGNASEKNTHKVTRGMCQVQETENQGVFKVPRSLLLIALLAATRWWGGRVSGLKLKVSPGFGVVGGMWTCVNIWFGDSLLVFI